MKWANKYRPKGWKTFRGHEDLVESIKANIDAPESPDTWFVTGDTGSGKTTMARLIARRILGVSLKDDIKIHPDYDEVNIGAERSKERMEEIASSLKFKPRQAAKKVYVLDEVHQLLGPAASVLLKPLEELPDHCVVVLATNEPEKVLKTIRDRATPVRLHKLDHEDLAAILFRIAQAEGVEWCTEEFSLTLAKSFYGETRRAIDTLQNLSNSHKRKIISVEDFNKEIQSALDFDQTQAADYLISMYSKKRKEACQISQNFSDAHYMVRNALDLNNYLLEKLTGVTSYSTTIRKILVKGLIKQNVSIQSVITTQDHLLQLQQSLITQTQAQPKQLMLLHTAKTILSL